MLNNSKKYPKNRRRGFTLVEVIVAISLITVGTLSAYGLINQTLVAASTSSMQLAAAYLGKEGIEIVKSIRDDNYLRIHYSATGYGDTNSWLSGLAPAGAPISVNCSNGCGADYSMRVLNPAYADQKLKFDGNFYNYYATDAKETVFSRMITVTPQANYMEARVEVKWQERGRSHSFRVQENIYNWWPQ